MKIRNRKESELVAGFMSEHGASIFVFFFLGEYSSLILMSAMMSIFFLGGHHCPDIIKTIVDILLNTYSYFVITFNYISEYITGSSYYSLINKSKVLSNNIGELYFNNISIEDLDKKGEINFNNKSSILSSISIFIDKIYGSYIFGLKIISVVFLYIWVRASFPRFRYDQLMSLCWKELLPLVFAYIIFTICLFYTFDMMPYGINF